MHRSSQHHGMTILAAALTASCTGLIGEALEDGASGVDRDLVVPSALPSVARRLTSTEYDTTIRDLVGDDTRPGSAVLPEDGGSPFDNDYAKQSPSAALVESAHLLASGVATRLVADPQRRAAILPCTPTGPGDRDCLRRFVESFGRRALRRPLTSDEVERYLALQSYATADYEHVTSDFFTAVGLVVEAMLQDLEFLYRVEIGSPVEGEPGVFRLNDFELATRMAYLLWGTTPDDALLDAAAAGRLQDPEQRRVLARRLLADPRAVAQVEAFHAQWLGYRQLGHSAELSRAMRAETAALIERVVFGEPRSYWELFLSDETFVDATLAEHYELAALPTQPAWVPYGQTGRRGILSHGTVLSAFSKFSDTSPTQRGIFIRTRLMCEEIPPPPPEVNADEPPPLGETDCKIDQYTQHRSGACAGCHMQTDPIGFGLENFDRAGRYRSHDDGRPECTIEGRGELVGVGAFRGPAELAALLLESGHLQSCAVRQLFRFAIGRREKSHELDLIEQLRRRFEARGWELRELLVELVASEQFAKRRED